MENRERLEILRHSCAHLMAAAVQEIFPDVKFAIGPAIENGFYYDFDLPRTLTPEDLELIEEKMCVLIKKNLLFEKTEVPIKKAIEIAESAKQTYKLELLEEIPGDKVTFYKTGNFVDLCRGPHVKSTNEIKYFKLLSIAGAYWRGNENNPMLQRIYGTCWETEEDLNKYLTQLEEAKKRDHRKIGQEMDLFSFHPEAPGMVFWHPKGKVIFDKLVEFSREKSKKYGFHEILTPNILNVNVWKTSGHWDHYKDAMYFAGGIDSKEQSYGIRPMGCPGSILIYKTKTHSYKELPIRYAEFDTLVRKELSGTLQGLFRVQQLTQDDAHLFLREDQILDEITSILKLVDETYKKLELRYTVNLSTRPAGFMGKIETWDKAEEDLKVALDKAGFEYKIKEGDGAFYGPKIDIDVLDALDRAWQCSTIQLDFQMPEKFELGYIDEKGKSVRPVMIHRVILGSIERFTGILLEHTSGNLPIWLAPLQVIILPVSDKHSGYARETAIKLERTNIRVEIDDRSESVGKKIRDAELQKIPYIVVVGDKEIKNKNITVRGRNSRELKTTLVKDFIKNLIYKE